jgi:type II secretory pathway pseudopilin PulG
MDATMLRVGLFLFYVLFCLAVLIIDVRSMMKKAGKSLTFRSRGRKVIPFRRVKGFSLLELMVVCAIIIIVISIAMPNAPAMIRAWNNQQAYQRVRTVSNAQAALAICAAQHQSCPGVSPLLPQQETMQTTTYTYIYAQNVWEEGSWWSYVAIPLDGKGRSFFVDATGIVRYCDNCSQAGQTSPVYQ